MQSIVRIRVIGDTRYGDNKRNGYFKKLGLQRLFLHSQRLAFTWKDKHVELEAPVDEKWAQAVQRLSA